MAQSACGSSRAIRSMSWSGGQGAELDGAGGDREGESDVVAGELPGVVDELGCPAPFGDAVGEVEGGERGGRGSRRGVWPLMPGR